MKQHQSGLSSVPSDNTIDPDCQAKNAIPDSYLLFPTLNRPDERLARFGLLPPLPARTRQRRTAGIKEGSRIYQIVNFRVGTHLAQRIAADHLRGCRTSTTASLRQPVHLLSAADRPRRGPDL